MTYTIKNKDGSAIFTNNNLGTITSEKITKDSQLFHTPLPQTDSKESLMLDIFGAKRDISISGIFNGTQAEITVFIKELDNMVNGNQALNKVYHSDYGYGSEGDGNYNVLIDRVSWETEQGAVTKLNYSIEMLEGAQL
jgi:hypothetical protein